MLTITTSLTEPCIRTEAKAARTGIEVCSDTREKKIFSELLLVRPREERLWDFNFHTEC